MFKNVALFIGIHFNCGNFILFTSIHHQLQDGCHFIFHFDIKKKLVKLNRMGATLLKCYFFKGQFTSHFLHVSQMMFFTSKTKSLRAR